MLHGYGIVNNHVPTLKATVMKISAAVSTLLTSLYAVYKGESNALASLTTSLYAVYKAESNTNDSLGTYNGTAQGGLTYTTGKSGNAFTFNGTTAYVSLPNNSFKFSSDFSISLWSNLAGTFSNVQALFSNITYDGTYTYGYYLYYYNNILTFQIANNSGAIKLNYTTASLFSTWKNIVITRKASTGTKMYIDGVLVASNTNVQNPNYHATMTPSIGAANYGPVDSNQVYYYTQNNGKLDEVNTWNRELSSTEVTELYNAGAGKFYQGNAFYSTVVNDSLGNYNGTAQGGLTYTAGKSGNAFTFNGTNAYVSLPNNSFNSILSGDFSISMWVNTTSLSSFQTLFSNFKSDGGGVYHGIILGINSNQFRLQIYNNTTEVLLQAGFSITTNTWNHIVITRKSSTGSKIYVNGSLNISNTNVTNPDIVALMYANIGAYMNASGVPSGEYMSNGSKIDEVNIWNKELTATEVTELYNASTGKFYPY